ncbi:VanZ family protein [Pseudobacteroides cellulosolvens]|uniref:VanZ family protein n=1 Tax=Pseudobacteroides cellulosolvens ATCC 35603 = DSM 2933 TaxID=398512 RepID=A0A0L6JI36_9FIRM|nr:VanZ family protein [Pseudobacteroides cellulosolvens]KNY25394.1 VanZ family protein [Pseudobacteroides cellulosolvens ATCC 35603 = DSM 2933]
MSIGYIVHQLLQYIIPATIVVCVLFAFAGACYFFVYKKLLKGTKAINKTKVIFSILLIVYLLVVFGLTCNRGAGIESTVNLELFRSYKDAWYTFTVRAWQFIIFNIVLLIPLGVILPLINCAFTKIRWALAAAFLSSLFIEVIQFMAKLGIFELDDLFHNTLGGMIGYCIFMFGYRIIKGTDKSGENANDHVRGASAAKFLVLPLIVIGAFLGIFIKYNLQEFGNMPIMKDTGADMSKYTIELLADISNEESFAPIYKYDHSWDEEFAISQAQKVMKDLNLPPFKSYLIQGEDIFFDFDNSSHCSIWWDRSNGTWNYSNHATEPDSRNVIKSEYEKYKIALDFAKSHNISLTNAILDSINKYNITFNINTDENNKIKNVSGRIVFDISDAGFVRSIRHGVYENSFVRNVDIISPQSAYEKILKGNFYDWEDVPGGKIEINDIKISYLYDTKGFYQPVYEFKGILNGREWNTCIAAMK